VRKKALPAYPPKPPSAYSYHSASPFPDSYAVSHRLDYGFLGGACVALFLSQTLCSSQGERCSQGERYIAWFVIDRRYNSGFRLERKAWGRQGAANACADTVDAWHRDSRRRSSQDQGPAHNLCSQPYIQQIPSWAHSDRTA
jgi:hypothetical protein